MLRENRRIESNYAFYEFMIQSNLYYVMGEFAEIHSDSHHLSVCIIV